MTPDIPGKLLTRLQSLFTSNKKLHSVILFGPRTAADCPPDARIRLAVSGPLGSRDLRQLRHQLSELRTSIPIDLVHLDHLDDPQQIQIINQQGIEIFKRKKAEASGADS